MEDVNGAARQRLITSHAKEKITGVQGSNEDQSDWRKKLRRRSWMMPPPDLQDVIVMDGWTALDDDITLDEYQSGTPGFGAIYLGHF
ncbi:hypothetical protein FKM82_029146 [Ascaphus truei]